MAGYAGPILGIVGAIFFGPVGGMIGSLIGNLLFPAEQKIADGPRLSDLKVTSSAYGQMIPIVFGSARIAGNVIFSTEKIEHTKDVEVDTGGKGGDTPKQKQYYYTQTLAIGICEGIVEDITKVYANGKCIYNKSDTASASTLIASSGIAKSIRVYKGTEDQLPDPALQALAGVENVSAYRGTAYIVFEDFDLSPYGQSMPNLEFEVVVAGQQVTSESTLVTVTEDIIITTLAPLNQYCWKIVEPFVGEYKFHYCKILQDGTVVPVYQYPQAFGYSMAYTIDADVLQKSNDNSLVIRALSGGVYSYWLLTKEGRWFELGIYGSQFTRFSNYKNLVIAYGNAATPTLINTNVGSVNQYIYEQIAAADFTDNYVYLETYNYSLSTIAIKKYDHSLNYISTIFTQSSRPIDLLGDIVAFNDNQIYYNYTKPYDRSWIAEISTGTEIIQHNSDYTVFNMNRNTLFFDGSNFLAYQKGGYSVYSVTLATKTNTITLGDVVKNLCLRSGLSSSQIDTTQIDSKVMYGYVLGKILTLRSAIEPLQSAYFFDGVDSDGKIKFIKRGGAVAVEIPADELAVHAYGSDTPDNVNTERKQDIELPYEITVSYFDLTGSYQISTQYARRQNTKAVNKISTELPMVLPPDEAKVIVDTMLSEHWQSRNIIKITLSMKYSYLEPSDIIVTYKNNNKLTLKIIDIEVQNGIMSLTTITEDITKYEQEAVGAKLTARDEEVYAVQPTNLEILDIPLLRDQDDKVGTYIAAGGYAKGWHGCSIMKSNDEGVTYNSIRILSKTASLGHTKTILGNYDGFMFDESNIVTVTCNNQLYSVNELSVLNGSNVALIGDEIIQFKNATLTAPNTYELSGLLRGKQGTEHYRNSHSIGERFVILNGNIDILQLPTSEYDLTRLYKGVSSGDFIENSITRTFTYAGIAQECYSPVQLGGGRDSAGNITLNWIRRSRINNSWNNKVDVPLGEDSENYEVDILNGSVVVRTLTCTTNTVNYSSANQITDFGSNQSNITFKVYQLSTLRGRGIPASGSV